MILSVCNVSRCRPMMVSNSIIQNILVNKKGVSTLKKIVLWLALTVVVVFMLASVAYAEPADIQGHWAENYIVTLLNQNVMSVYPNGQFRPNQDITRGEFAEALAKALFLNPVTQTDLKDIANYPGKDYIAALVKENIVTGFPDKTFRPDESLTRAQVVTMLTKSLGLAKKSNQINMHSFASYLDMNEQHWANQYVKIATELEILNGYPDGTFKPNDATSRAEAAKMIDAMKSFANVSGFVSDIYPESNKLSVTTLSGKRTIVNIADSALIGRNNRLVPITDFLKTDKVFILSDANGQAHYIKAYGLITKSDLSEEVSQMTNYVLDSYEVEALAKGDYNVVKPKLMNEVRDRLSKVGMTPAETDNLLNTDWNALKEDGKARLGEAVAQSSGLPLDIVEALMAQDWNKVKELAKVEAIQEVVKRMMDTDLFS